MTSFLIAFGKLERADDYKINQYCKTQLRIMSAFNPSKKDLAEIKEMEETGKDISKYVNSWVLDAYKDKKLDLQNAATIINDQDLKCILLDLQLYDNPDLVSKVFKLLISYYRQKMDVYNLAAEVQILQDD